MTAELQKRASFPLLQVVDVIREMSQQGLLDERPVEQAEPTAELSEAAGLDADPAAATSDDLVSLTPQPLE